MVKTPKEEIDDYKEIIFSIAISKLLNLFLTNNLSTLITTLTNLDLDNPNAKLLSETLINAYKNFYKEDSIEQEKIKKAVESLPKEIKVRIKKE